MSKTLCGLWMVAMLASAAGAQELYLPAAAHTAGAAGTVWRSDLEVRASDNSAAVFTIELLEERSNNSDPLAADFTLTPGQSLRLVDVVGVVFGFDGSAALRLTATEGEILATSRTYNDSPNGTYGQYIPAFAAEAAAEPGFDYVLMQLTSTAAYRTNVGFVNATGDSEILEIDLHAASGDLLGSIEATLRPYEMRQISNVFAQVTGDDVDDGYAVVRTRDDGGRFFAYASVVDNLSGDAIFVPAQPGGATSVELAPRTVVFEAFMRHG